MSFLKKLLNQSKLSQYESEQKKKYKQYVKLKKVDGKLFHKSESDIYGDQWTNLRKSTRKNLKKSPSIRMTSNRPDYDRTPTNTVVGRTDSVKSKTSMKQYKAPSPPRQKQNVDTEQINGEINDNIQNLPEKKVSKPPRFSYAEQNDFLEHLDLELKAKSFKPEKEIHIAPQPKPIRQRNKQNESTDPNELEFEENGENSFSLEAKNEHVRLDQTPQDQEPSSNQEDTYSQNKQEQSSLEVDTQRKNRRDSFTTNASDDTFYDCEDFQESGTWSNLDQHKPSLEHITEEKGTIENQVRRFDEGIGSNLDDKTSTNIMAGDVLETPNFEDLHLKFETEPYEPTHEESQLYSMDYIWSQPESITKVKYKNVRDAKSERLFENEENATLCEEIHTSEEFREEKLDLKDDWVPQNNEYPEDKYEQYRDEFTSEKQNEENTTALLDSNGEDWAVFKIWEKDSITQVDSIPSSYNAEKEKIQNLNVSEPSFKIKDWNRTLFTEDGDLNYHLPLSENLLNYNTNFNIPKENIEEKDSILPDIPEEETIPLKTFKDDLVDIQNTFKTQFDATEIDDSTMNLSKQHDGSTTLLKDFQSNNSEENTEDQTNKSMTDDAPMSNFQNTKLNIDVPKTTPILKMQSPSSTITISQETSPQHPKVQQNEDFNGSKTNEVTKRIKTQAVQHKSFRMSWEPDYSYKSIYNTNEKTKTEDSKEDFKTKLNRSKAYSFQHKQFRASWDPSYENKPTENVDVRPKAHSFQNKPFRASSSESDYKYEPVYNSNFFDAYKKKFAMKQDVTENLKDFDKKTDNIDHEVRDESNKIGEDASKKERVDEKPTEENSKNNMLAKIDVNQKEITYEILSDKNYSIDHDEEIKNEANFLDDQQKHATRKPHLFVFDEKDEEAIEEKSIEKYEEEKLSNTFKLDESYDLHISKRNNPKSFGASQPFQNREIEEKISKKVVFNLDEPGDLYALKNKSPTHSNAPQSFQDLRKFNRNECEEIEETNPDVPRNLLRSLKAKKSQMGKTEESNENRSTDDEDNSTNSPKSFQNHLNIRKLTMTKFEDSDNGEIEENSNPDVPRNLLRNLKAKKWEMGKTEELDENRGLFDEERKFEDVDGSTDFRDNSSLKKTKLENYNFDEENLGKSIENLKTQEKSSEETLKFASEQNGNISEDLRISDDRTINQHTDNKGEEDNGLGNILGNDDLSLEELSERLFAVDSYENVFFQMKTIEEITLRLGLKIIEFDSRNDEQHPLMLHMLLKSVRIVSGLKCGFDPKLLDSQQTVLNDIQNCIYIMNNK